MQEENVITISGRIVAPPEMRFTPNSLAVTNFRIARNDRVRDGNDWKDGPSKYYDVTAWRKLAERVAELPVGILVSVRGKLDYQQWEDKETGAKRSRHTIEASSVAIELIALRELEGVPGELLLRWGKQDKQAQEEEPPFEPQQLPDEDEGY